MSTRSPLLTFLIPTVAIICISALDAYAISKGIDGVVHKSVCGIIAGVAISVALKIKFPLFKKGAPN